MRNIIQPLLVYKLIASLNQETGQASHATYFLFELLIIHVILVSDDDKTMQIKVKLIVIVVSLLL